MKRVDIHRPSAIIPEDYEFVCCDYSGGGLESIAAILENHERFRKHKERTGGHYSQHEHGGGCHICGASIRYQAMFYHVKTNSYIVTGLDCAAKLELGGDDECNDFRSRVQRGLEAVAGKRKAQAVLEAAGLSAAWQIYTATNIAGHRYEEGVIYDIVSKLVGWGDLSEKQIGFLRLLVDKIAARAVIAAKREEERAAAKPIPAELLSGERVTIVGRILSFKTVETDFGPTIKALIAHADGWKVWGTRPDVGDKGDLVQFVARLQPSKDDTKFGFYKRPTKSVVLERAQQEAA